MEEFRPNLTPQQPPVNSAKQKSTNRFFGLFLGLDIVLGMLIIAEIISIIVTK